MEEYIEEGAEYIDEEDDNDTENVMLPTGNVLSIDKTYNITAKEKSHFIVLVGAAESGKTSLVVSLYQQFLQEKFPKKYFFAGSETLYAFEERAFYTRTTSMQRFPQQLRTQNGSLDSILHLRVRNKLNDKYINLLLTDFSGEDYEDIVGNVEMAKEEFQVIQSSKYIIMLLDGARLVLKRFRQAEVQRSIQILRTFYDSNLLCNDVKIILTISKFDLISRKTDEKLDDFIIKIPKLFTDQLPNLKNNFIMQKVASMPKDTSSICIGYGNEEMLDLLIEENEKQNEAFSDVTLKSQFNLFKRRLG